MKLFKLSLLFLFLFANSVFGQSAKTTFYKGKKVAKNNLIILANENTKRNPELSKLKQQYGINPSGSIEPNIEQWSFSGNLPDVIHALDSIGIVAIPNYVIEKPKVKRFDLDFTRQKTISEMELELTHADGTIGILHENPFGNGYICGADGIGSTAKYQRIDIENNYQITELGFHFGHISVVNQPDTLVFAIREMKNDKPGRVLASDTFQTNQLPCCDTIFRIIPEHKPIVSKSVFVGVEWKSLSDDRFALFADENGGGDLENRVWERDRNGKWQSVLSQWNLNADMWISVKANAINYNDPELPVQYSLHNNGSFSSFFNEMTDNAYNILPSKAGADCKAFKAWEVTTGSPETVVAVLDEGIDVNHPDLKQNIWTNPGEIPENGIDDDQNGYIDDIHGWCAGNRSGNTEAGDHGTHITGIIGATTNNSLGISGINHQIKMISVDVFGGDEGGYLFTILRGYDYLNSLLEQGINIVAVNQSWGTDIDMNSESGKLLCEKMTGFATQHQNMAWVVSGGNNAFTRDELNRYSIPNNLQSKNIIVVGATGSADEVCDFSDYGKRNIDTGAPGDWILSTVVGSYALMSGTSMAAPHITGTLALTASQYPDESISARVCRILASCDKNLLTLPYHQTTERPWMSNGRLNAFSALKPGETNAGILLCADTIFISKTVWDDKGITNAGFINATENAIEIEHVGITGEDASFFTVRDTAASISPNGSFGTSILFFPAETDKIYRASIVFTTDKGEIIIPVDAKQQGFAQISLSSAEATAETEPGTNEQTGNYTIELDNAYPDNSLCTHFCIHNNGNGDLHFEIEQNLTTLSPSKTEILEKLNKTNIKTDSTEKEIENPMAQIRLFSEKMLAAGNGASPRRFLTLPQKRHIDDTPLWSENFETASDWIIEDVSTLSNYVDEPLGEIWHLAEFEPENNVLLAGNLTNGYENLMWTTARTPVFDFSELPADKKPYYLVFDYAAQLEKSYDYFFINVLYNNASEVKTIAATLNPANYTIDFKELANDGQVHKAMLEISEFAGKDAQFYFVTKADNTISAGFGALFDNVQIITGDAPFFSMPDNGTVTVGDSCRITVTLRPEILPEGKTTAYSYIYSNAINHNYGAISGERFIIPLEHKIKYQNTIGQIQLSQSETDISDLISGDSIVAKIPVLIENTGGSDVAFSTEISITQPEMSRSNTLQKGKIRTEPFFYEDWEAGTGDWTIHYGEFDLGKTEEWQIEHRENSVYQNVMFFGNIADSTYNGEAAAFVESKPLNFSPENVGDSSRLQLSFDYACLLSQNDEFAVWITYLDENGEKQSENIATTYNNTLVSYGTISFTGIDISRFIGFDEVNVIFAVWTSDENHGFVWFDNVMIEKIPLDTYVSPSEGIVERNDSENISIHIKKNNLIPGDYAIETTFRYVYHDFWKDRYEKEEKHVTYFTVEAPPNRKPVAIADTLITEKNGKIVLDEQTVSAFLDNDRDADSADVLTIVSDEYGDPKLDAPEYGEILWNAEEHALIYRAPDFITTDRFDYYISDGKDEAKGTIVVNVLEKYPPEFFRNVAQTYSFLEDESLTINTFMMINGIEALSEKAGVYVQNDNNDLFAVQHDFENRMLTFTGKANQWGQQEIVFSLGKIGEPPIDEFPATLIIIPVNDSPSPDFSYQKQKNTVYFTDNSTDKNDPQGTVVARKWHFGDGTTSAEINPAHTYQSMGMFTARLEITDNYGATNYTEKNILIDELSAIQHVEQSIKIKCFPNPVSNMLHIEISQNIPLPLQLECFDITGKCIFSVKKEKNMRIQSFRFDVSNVAPGMYWVKCSDKNTVTRKKIVINR